MTASDHDRRSADRRPPPAVVRRRRVIAGVALAVILAATGAAVAAALGTRGRGPGRHRGAPASSRLASATRTSTSSSTTRVSVTHARPAVPRGPFPVARTTLSLVESHAAGSAQAGVRRLPTVVRFPDVARHGGGGPFPLIVFSQGFDISAAAYGALLRTWSAAGFIVAAPTYPDTDPQAPGGPDESDIVNHPSDLRFVIGAVIRAATRSSSPLHGLLDAARVAVVGQSDGGDVSLAVAENSCCRDPAVRAAVILSGAELSSFGGSYFAGPTVPLLVVQGTADTINAPACSAQIYDQAPQPKYYLDLPGAQHLPPYVDPGATRRGVARVVVGFLDAYLERRPTELRRLRSRLHGDLLLSAGHQAPVPEGSCPGAP